MPMFLVLCFFIKLLDYAYIILLACCFSFFWRGSLMNDESTSVSHYNSDYCVRKVNYILWFLLLWELIVSHDSSCKYDNSYISQIRIAWL